MSIVDRVCRLVADLCLIGAFCLTIWDWRRRKK